MQLNAHFGLAFATAPWLDHLTLLHTSNSPAHYAKGTPSAVSKPKFGSCLRPLVSRWFQVLFTLRQECFSPFPHGTCSLSVVREYLALEGGPPSFLQDFTCPAVLGNLFQRVCAAFVYRTFTFCGPTSQTVRLTGKLLTLRSLCSRIQTGPTTPTSQRLQALT